MDNIHLHLKHGSFAIILLQLITLWLPESSAIDPACNYEQKMEPGLSYYVYNSEYPDYYGPSQNCRWVATAPTGYQINITCSIDLPSSLSCNQDRVTISLTGNVNFENSNVYCGNGNISLQTESNSISIALIASSFSGGGKFLCTMQTVYIPKPCDCGWKKPYRIVGGVETETNEFPMMAGLIDYEKEELFCGATIIATRYAVSTAHCFRELTAKIIGLLVGDHDISTGADTNAAKLYNIEYFKIHPKFKFSNIEAGYDIAIVKTKLYIEFSEAVGPACLPLRYYEEPFTDQNVEVLGWGTDGLTGPTSEVLLKTDLKVLSAQDCYKTMNGSEQQMCTYTKGHDSCQFDSGGPLLWHNAERERLFLVGMVSTGIGCGGSTPGVNTRITTFMPWIMANTIDADYCVK